MFCYIGSGIINIVVHIYLFVHLPIHQIIFGAQIITEDKCLGGDIGMQTKKNIIQVLSIKLLPRK